MKTKKIVAALLAGTLAATAVVSVSAAELTNDNPGGSTEVTAKIEGAGNVSYVITIPEKVDFGTLTQPAENTDSYKYVNDSVVATQLNFKNGVVSVYAKSGSSDGVFSLAQKNVIDNPFVIPYDIYTAQITSDTEVGDNVPVNQAEPGRSGYYHITTFTADAQGTEQPITLALNQKNLYGQNLDTIAGDYSGTIVFYSEWKGI